MSLLPTIGAVDQDTGFYNGVATQSLRFSSARSTRLEKTPNASNRQVWTWAGWVKRSSLGASRAFWSVTSSAHFAMFFNSDDSLRVWVNGGNGAIYTNALFRDTSAWYHIALTSKSSGNYFELYINGVKETSFSHDARSSYPGGNDTEVNSNAIHYLGTWNNGGLQYFDGYLADVNFLDGVTVGDTSGVLDEFIEIKNGACIPKKYTGSYGTNGYRLEFKQTGLNGGTGTSSTVGADTANSNHYDSSGISAYDSNMPDNPENNFSTWNALFRGGEASSSIAATSTLSEGNLQVSVPQNSYMGNTFRPASGKWYCEFRVKTVGSTNGEIDWGWIQATTYAGTTGHSGQANKWGAYYHAYSTDHIKVYDETSQLGSNINLTISAGSVLQLAWDIDNNKGWIGIDDTYYAADNGTDGNPSAGTNQTFTFTADEAQNLQCYVANGTSTDVYVANFGQDSTFGGDETATTNADANGKGAFHHAPPTGFLALCSANLEEPTIGPNSTTNTTDHFNTVLIAGDGGADSITGVGFQPDMIWAKNRTSGYQHELWDSTRGVNSTLFPAEAYAADTTASRLVSFDADGFSWGTNSNIYVNSTNSVAWNWKANGGTTATNNNGDGQSTVQANTTAGFSIVTYTGSTNETYGHGLSQAPEMIWVKSPNVAHSWAVYHKELDLIDDDTFVELNTDTTRQEGSNPRFLNGTTGDSIPTSSVFKVNHYSGSSTNATNNSDTYVAYCFHPVEGYSKMGFYSGNGNADGPFCFTGFRPAWIIIKRVDTTENWWLYDNKRDPDNPLIAILYADLPNSEVTGTGDNIALDFVSNGVKFRTDNVNWNASGGQYIYMAFAEAPFKYANAR